MSSPERIFENSHSRFPNEISTIIIKNLANDRPSLRSLALVCKDFAPIAQSLIFQVIRLKGFHWPYCGLKYDAKIVKPQALWQGSTILRFVRQLHVDSMRDAFDKDESDTARILSSMTGLTALNFSLPASVHFRAIQSSSLVETLRILHITILDTATLSAFASMLLSLKLLEVLAITGDNGDDVKEHVDIVLPRSIRVAFLADIQRDIIHAIGSGLESSKPPLLCCVALKDIDVDQEDITPACSEIWNRIGTDIQIVVIADDFEQVTGFSFTKLIWMWKQDNFLAADLRDNCIPSSLPLSVRELTIDIQAGRQERAAISRHWKSWAELDNLLMERHGGGSLTRVCFRCTSRDGFFHFEPSLCSQEKDVQDRSILDDIESLLPKSRRTGFLEVDRDMKIFAPKM